MSFNFIVFSLAPWNLGYGSNIKDLSVELSKQHQVLYIDVPLKRKDKLLKPDYYLVKEAKERIDSNKQLIKMQDNLWHYIPEETLDSVHGIKNNFLFDVVNKINNKRFAKAIRKAAKAVGFEEYILINDNNIYDGFYLKEMLQPSLYVYYLRDKLAAMKYWKKQVSRLEPKLLPRVDLVVANSEYLADYAREYKSDSYYVGQGCDVSQFLVRSSQEDIDRVFNDIPRPIVGYTGALNGERLDIGLIEYVANQLQDHSFVFIGPEDAAFQNSNLHSLKNVFFLGKKDFSELPLYMNGFDATINPQALNEITIGNYPRKVDEYLAGGKPVVATDTIAMNPFREYTYLCKTPEEYVQKIPMAIQENNETLMEARRKFACEHTWPANAKSIIDSILKVKDN